MFLGSKESWLPLLFDGISILLFVWSQKSDCFDLSSHPKKVTELKVNAKRLASFFEFDIEDFAT